ncbi:MAG: diaminopimelate decarboxylase [Planctomycetaceae bacterium]|nr:diaminopimelate decarboxylase [Planctomycetaceae bacterium]
MIATQYDGKVLTEIAGFSISQLVAEHGSPVYLYDAETIRQRCRDLQMFETVRFAQKACSNLSILALLKEQGIVVDAVSAGEVLRALAVGYSATSDPPEIVYTSDIFDRDALQVVAEHHIHCNLGSPDMIPQLAEVQPGAEITLRINPGFGHGHSQKTNTGGPQSKHGIWHEQLPSCLAQAKACGLKVVGLHMHIGSGTDLEHLAQVCEAMERCARLVGPTLKTISAGGGLPTVYRAGQQGMDLAQYHRLWDEVRNRLAADFGHPIGLELEPGRYLVAESGYLLTEIRAVKKMGDNLFYLVDAGFNNLARPILYGAYHPMAICPVGQRTSNTNHDVVVGGPLCESGDIFTQEDGGVVSRRSLPAAQVGDLLVIGCTGAYGAVMASNYNSKPLAAEIMLDRGELRIIRHKQTLEDLIANERSALETVTR